MCLAGFEIYRGLNTTQLLWAVKYDLTVDSGRHEVTIRESKTY